MVITNDSYTSPGYQQQAYVSQGDWYPETGYQGLLMGYNKPSPPHTSHQMMVDGGHTYQHGYGYKPDAVVHSNLPTHAGVGAHNVPGVPGTVQAVEYSYGTGWGGKVQAVEYSYGTGWDGNSPQFPAYGQYPGNGYAYWSVKGV